MPEIDRKRLALLLTIAATSAHDGEILNAVRVACRMVKAASLTWDAVLAPAPAVPPPRPPPRPPPPPPEPEPEPDDEEEHQPDAYVMHRVILRTGMPLKPKEARFMESIEPWLHRLTPRQRAWLDDLFEAALAWWQAHPRRP